MPDDRNIPLEDMGPLLATMDEEIRTLQASIAALRTGGAVTEPAASLVAELSWVRSQLETDRRRLDAVTAFLNGLTPNSSVTAAKTDAASLRYRVNQLYDALTPLGANLGVAGASAAVAALDRGTVAVTELIGRLETRAAGMTPGTSTLTTTTEPKESSILVPVAIAGALGVILGAVLASG